MRRPLWSVILMPCIAVDRREEEDDRDGAAQVDRPPYAVKGGGRHTGVRRTLARPLALGASSKLRRKQCRPVFPTTSTLPSAIALLLRQSAPDQNFP
jgi:hypothetical protein